MRERLTGSPPTGSGWATALTACGELGASDPLDHDVVLRPAGGRNHAVVLEVDGHPRCILKTGERVAIANELRTLAELARTPSLARHVPVARSAPGHLAVVEWVEAEPLRPSPPPPAGVLHELGRVIAELHRLPAPPEPATAPWVTRIHRPTPRRLAWSSAGVVSVIRAVQADTAVTDALDSLAVGWSAAALTHGDLRCDNVLARPGSPAVVIVDWEAAGPGDPLADLGGMAGDLLAGWASSMDPRQGADALMLASAGRALLNAETAVAALWSGCGRTGSELPIALRWAGARLVQIAAERSQLELFPDPLTRPHLLAARIALTRPEDLAARILDAA